MKESPVTDLLVEAVEALTAPVIENIAQKDDDGNWVRTHVAVHAPLLRQLADAVNPSKNSGAGTPATPATRSLLNFEAMFLLAKISSQIRDWCRIAKVNVTRPPHVDILADLDAWCALVGRDDTDWYVRQLRLWAGQIRDTLNPGESFEAHIVCPVCGATSWGDVINGGSSWSIQVMYRLDDTEKVTNERALCRACNTLWQGHDAVKELSDEAKEATA
jgi:hypothetical protein